MKAKFVFFYLCEIFAQFVAPGGVVRSVSRHHLVEEDIGIESEGA